MLLTNAAEFFTVWGEFPARGVRIHDSSLASLYNGEPMHDGSHGSALNRRHPPRKEKQVWLLICCAGSSNQRSSKRLD